jgi:predicted glycogen debranching enzyme
VDATLWYFEALRAYHAVTGDTSFVHQLVPVLQDIVGWHVQGTRHHIKVDPADGLLYAGEAGQQLTWMDAKVGEWVVTPRVGKPVEVNALWYNALCILAEFTSLVGINPEPYRTMAEQARQGFGRFWNEELGFCTDVLDGPGGNDTTLRPNQLLAVSLPHSPLAPEQQKAVVDVCARRLLTSHGLRTLPPDHPAYFGSYGGELRLRDAAYHQGTVWCWLLGPFVAAHLQVYRDQEAARSILRPLLHDLSDGGLGSLNEIYDGDPPFAPRGCIAQAWSVGEVLRAWSMLKDEA